MGGQCGDLLPMSSFKHEYHYQTVTFTAQRDVCIRCILYVAVVMYAIHRIDVLCRCAVVYVYECMCVCTIQASSRSVRELHSNTTEVVYVYVYGGCLRYGVRRALRIRIRMRRGQHQKW